MKTSEALATYHLQSTVTMATAEKRFHVPSEEEIDKLLTDKDSINTQKATKLSMKCFRDYLREQDPDNVEFEEVSLEHLNNSLKLLYVGARKTDGNHFKISALQKC
jgi:hypothetical protein